MIEYIVMGHFSSLCLFEYDNWYILGAIIRLKIPTSHTEEQKTLLTDFDSVNDMQLEEMIGQGTADDFFKQAFILYALSSFFCPTLEIAPSPKLLGAIVDVENVLKYNWSKLIFD